MLPEALTLALERHAPEALEPPFAAVAWSGGADSTALLRAYLEALRARHGAALPCPVLAIHIDHNVRPDSGDDARWCRDQVEGLAQVRLVVRRLEPGELEALREGQARQARYRALGQEARAAGLGMVMTAHHAGDALESALLAMARGSGLTGVAGPRRRARLDGITGEADDAAVEVIKPMLEVDPRAPREHLEAGGHPWLEDPTNDDQRHRRNLLRARVIPALLEVADDPASLWRTMALLDQERGWQEERADEALKAVWAPLPVGVAEGLALWRGALAALEPMLRAHVMREALKRAGAPHRADRAWIQRMEEALARPEAGTWQVSTPGAPDALITPTQVVLGARRATPPLEARLEAPGALMWGRGRIEARVRALEAPARIMEMASALEHRPAVEMFDGDALAWPLRIRPPAPGEHLRRPGRGTKRLSRLLIDLKIPRASRPWVPVIEDGQGAVLWVAGVARSDRAMVTGQTRRVLELTWSSAPGQAGWGD